MFFVEHVGVATQNWFNYCWTLCEKNKDKHRIDVNEKDFVGKTAFYWASKENVKLEKLLLDNAKTFNIDTNGGINLRKRAKKR